MITTARKTSTATTQLRRVAEESRGEENGLSEYAAASLAKIADAGARRTVERYLHGQKANGKKARTIEIAATHLSFFSNEVDKPLAKVTRTDLERHLARMRNERTGGPAGKASLELRRGVLKVFYKWLFGYPKAGRPFPPNVEWIKSHRTPKERLPEDMLDKDEVRKLIDTANGTREKALVAALYESGTRISEFLSLRIRDVHMKDGGYAVLTLPVGSAGDDATPSLKTGRRQITVVECVPYLQLWLDSHPAKGDGSAYLWPSGWGKREDAPADGTTVLKLLQRLQERAGIDSGKNVTPHLLRHSRATECARRGWNESQMRRYFGWTRSSPMPSLYTHLAAGDVQARVLEDNGLASKPEQKADPLAPLVCGRCGKRNPATAVYCFGCGAVVSVEKAMQIERKTEAEGRLQMENMANPQIVAMAKKLAESLVAQALSSMAQGATPRPA